MDAGFSNLVDYLRGELPEPARREIRARLEAEPALFDQYQRLRRTYAILRSLPRLSAARPGFEADLRREFDSRGWSGLLPALQPAVAFTRRLRVEFAVRGLVAGVPALEVQAAWRGALRAQFAVRAVVASLPAARVRTEWVRVLRHEFTARAVLASLPLLEVRPEFAAALRARFAAPVPMLPAIEVTDRFRRRLQLALQDAAEGDARTLLPAIRAEDSFRRRLFRKILLSRGTRAPRRLDLREYQLGRQMAGAMRRARRPLVATLTAHALVVLILLMVVGRPASQAPAPVAILEGTRASLPPLPDRAEGPLQTPAFMFPEGFQHPGLDSSTARSAIEDPDVPPPPPRERPLDQVHEPTSRDAAEAAPNAIGLGSGPAAGVWYRLRGQGRREKIEYLGNDELYNVLERALRYLQITQMRDGGWGHVDVNPRIVPRDEDLRTAQRVEMTAAAVLAFLGDGHSSTQSALGYDWNVRRAMDWLIARQQPDGRIGAPDLPIVLGHAMATLALAEDFAMTRDARLREPLRRACRWLSAVRAADGSGAFPYRVGQGPSLTTGVWAHMALTTARSLQVPARDADPQRVEALLEWFQAETRGFKVLTDTQDVLAAGDLLPSAGAATLSALAVDTGFEMRRAVFLQRIGRETPSLQARVGGSDAADVRYLFFGSLATTHERERVEITVPWNRALAETLIAAQHRDGALEGSFDTTSDYADLYGRVFTTAFAALAIENPWRLQR